MVAVRKKPRYGLWGGAMGTMSVSEEGNQMTFRLSIVGPLLVILTSCAGVAPVEETDTTADAPTASLPPVSAAVLEAHEKWSRGKALAEQTRNSQSAEDWKGLRDHLESLVDILDEQVAKSEKVQALVELGDAYLLGIPSDRVSAKQRYLEALRLAGVGGFEADEETLFEGAPAGGEEEKPAVNQGESSVAGQEPSDPCEDHPKGRKKDGRYEISGPSDSPNPHWSRAMAKEMAKTSGVISYISVHDDLLPSAEEARTKEKGSVDLLLPPNIDGSKDEHALARQPWRSYAEEAAVAKALYMLIIMHARQLEALPMPPFEATNPAPRHVFDWWLAEFSSFDAGKGVDRWCSKRADRRRMAKWGYWDESRSVEEQVIAVEKEERKEDEDMQYNFWATNKLEPWYQRKKESLKAILEQVAVVQEHRVPEWIMAAAALEGDLLLRWIDEIAAVPSPPAFDEDPELKEIYLRSLNTRLAPYKRAAVRAFEYCVEIGEKAGISKSNETHKHCAQSRHLPARDPRVEPMAQSSSPLE